MVNGAGTMADSGIRADGFPDESLRPRDGIGDACAQSEFSRDCRREGATGSMRVYGVDPRSGELIPVIAVEQDVSRRSGEVAALYEDGSRAHLTQAQSRFPH